jgi:transcription elongation factor GreA-like protein
MVIDDLKTSSSYRLSRILNVLESTHGVTIDFSAFESLAELQSLHEAYGQQRSKIISESAFNSYNENPQYNEAVLIQEALGIFLSEVAPKRIKRNKTSA